jgi:AraC-like DNA-binding protein
MPSIEKLSEDLFISESILKRNFKEIYKTNIYRFYLEKKMYLARNLLSKNEMNVSQVAETLGYESVSHFITIFKKIHGCSPSEVQSQNN